MILADEKKALVNSQKLSGWAGLAYDLLYGEKDSAIVKLKDVQNQIKEIKKIDSNFKIADADIESSFITLQEAALQLRDYGKKLYFDSERLAVIEERLEQLNRLKRKHGGSLESVLHRKKEIEEYLKTVFSVEEELEKLTREEEKLKDNLRQNAVKLSEVRKQAAKKLQDAVDKEIQELNMPHASFFVNFEKDDGDTAEYFGPKGTDGIEFYLTANKGEETKPLNKVASGRVVENNSGIEKCFVAYRFRVINYFRRSGQWYRRGSGGDYRPEVKRGICQPSGYLYYPFASNRLLWR